MKPILFAKDETDFTTNGLGRLDCISCKVIEERNGMFELEAEIPVSSVHAGEIEQLSIIGAKAHDGGNIQAFTVYKITKPMNGRFMVYARHLSYRLSDIPCSPFTVAASPQAAANTLAGLKNNALEPCPFNFSTDVTTGNPYTQNVPASIRQRLGGVEGSVLDQFGGEFEFDNWNVKLWKSRGRLSNVTGISLRYGKNITDINQEEEIATTVTGVVPYWIDTDGNNLVTLPEHVIYADNAANYPYHITQVLDLSSEFEEKPTVAQLRGIANAYVHKDGFGVPKVSIKVSFANLWESEEYKDIAPLERVQLCDEVSVYFEKLGISSIAKVVKTDFDVLKERYNNVEVGNLRTTLAQAVTDRDKDIDTTFIQEMTRVSTAITNATAWLTNANGYVVAVKNTDGSWKELLFMNTNDPQTATQGIRFNNNGIGFWNKATDGGNVLDGPYGTAWTIDGRLGDFADKNFWNIRTGDFSLSASATVGGQTVQQIADAAQAAAEATAAAALATTAEQLQEQIDGQIMTWFYDYEPKTNNAPANTWATVDDKINHIGDLFYWSSKGYCYRWQVKTTAVDPTHPTANDFEWVQIADTEIAEALQLAGEKRRVFVSTPVPPYDIGDLWVQGSTGDIKRCATAKISGQTYSSSDWVLASKYTDDTAVTNLDNSLNQQGVYKRLTNNSNAEGIFLQNGHLYLNASMINAGEMSADRIQGGALIVGGVDNSAGVINILGDGVVYDSGSISAGDDASISCYGLSGYLVIDVSSTQSEGAIGRTRKYYGQGDYGPWIDLYNGHNLIGFDDVNYNTIDIEAYYSLSYSIVTCPADTLINKNGIYTSNIRIIKGLIAGLSAENQEIYKTGSMYLKKNKLWTISRSGSTKSYSFVPSLLYIKNSTFKVSFSFAYADTPVARTGSAKLQYKIGSSWTDVETKSSIHIEGGFTYTFNTEISSSSTTKYRIQIIADSYTQASGIRYNILIENVKVVSLSSAGVYGNFYGSLVGNADLDSADIGIFEIDSSGLSAINTSDINQRIYLDFDKLSIEHGGGDYMSVKHSDIDRVVNSTTYHPTWTTSDIRVKEAIHNLNTELSMRLIDATETHRFKYKGADGTHYGMIAQEARELLDSLGETDARLEHSMGLSKEETGIDDQRTIDYQEYIPHLINYVKELRDVVDRQQAEIDELKEIVKKLSV